MPAPEMEIVELPHFRRAMKNLGYKVQVRTFSSFKVATVVDQCGSAINLGNVMTSDHLERYKPFYDYRNSHSVRDADWFVRI